MAKYDIEHACGHEVTHNLGGKVSDRARKEDWLAEQPCADCRHRDANDAAKSAAAERGLVSLVGTEKQIAWAETIRLAALEDLDVDDWRVTWGVKLFSGYTEAERADMGVTDRASAIAWLDNLRAVAIKIADAAWWIEHRDSPASDALTMSASR